jgi:hypothetical protein
MGYLQKGKAMQIIINIRYHQGRFRVWIERYKTRKWAKKEPKPEPPEKPEVKQEALEL